MPRRPAPEATKVPDCDSRRLAAARPLILEPGWRQLQGPVPSHALLTTFAARPCRYRARRLARTCKKGAVAVHKSAAISLEAHSSASPRNKVQSVAGWPPPFLPRALRCLAGRQERETLARDEYLTAVSQAFALMGGV